MSSSDEDENLGQRQQRLKKTEKPPPKAKRAIENASSGSESEEGQRQKPKRQQRAKDDEDDRFIGAVPGRWIAGIGDGGYSASCSIHHGLYVVWIGKTTGRDPTNPELARVEWCEMNTQRRGACEFYFAAERPVNTVNIEDAILEWDVPVEEEGPGTYVLPRAHMEQLRARLRALLPVVALLGEGADGPEVWLGQVVINARSNDLDCYYLDREPNSTTLFRMSKEISVIHRSSILDVNVAVEEVPRRPRVYSVSEAVQGRLQALLKQEVRARAELDRGVGLLEAGQYDAALVAFAAAEELMVGSKAEIHINRACLYTRQGKHPPAVAELQRALQCHAYVGDFEDEKDLQPLKADPAAAACFAKPPPAVPPIPPAPPSAPPQTASSTSGNGTLQPRRQPPTPKQKGAAAPLPKPPPKKRLRPLAPKPARKKSPKQPSKRSSKASQKAAQSSSSSDSGPDSSSSSSTNSSLTSDTDESEEEEETAAAPRKQQRAETANGLLHPPPKPKAAPKELLKNHAASASTSPDPATTASAAPQPPPSSSAHPPPTPTPSVAPHAAPSLPTPSLATPSPPPAPPAPAPAAPPTAALLPVDDAALETSAAAWNAFWRLPAGGVGVGWRFLPPLMDVKEFLLVEQPHFPPGGDLSAPIAFRPTSRQMALLRDPRMRVWIGEYRAENRRFVRWNIFTCFVVNGLRLRRDSYRPQSCNLKHYHGPILIDLLAAGARLADLELIQIQFQKELQGYRSIKKQKEGEDCNYAVDHVVLCIGYELQPDDFLSRKLTELPRRPYRAEDDGLTCTWYDLNLKDPMTFTRINHPVRGKDCEHLACCDLATLLMQSKEMRNSFEWVCGICQRPMSGLVYDPEVRDLLQRYPALTEIKVDLSRWGQAGYVPDPRQAPPR